MIRTPVRSVENALCASGKTDVVVDAAGKILSTNVMAQALNTAAADREKLERRFSDEEIRAWAERHDISGVPTDLRQMFEDARTL